MIKMWVEILLLALAIPVGWLIAKLTKDERAMGTKYFVVLIIISILGAILFSIVGISYIAWTFGFMFVVSLISLIKSKKLTRSKI